MPDSTLGLGFQRTRTELAQSIFDSPVTHDFVKEDCSRHFWAGEVHSNRESAQDSKPRHFKPFEYFDHTDKFGVALATPFRASCDSEHAFNWPNIRTRNNSDRRNKKKRRSVTSQAPPVLPQRKPYLTGSPPSRQERRYRQACRVIRL
jgi:hypothetical protein